MILHEFDWSTLVGRETITADEWQKRFVEGTQAHERDFRDHPDAARWRNPYINFMLGLTDSARHHFCEHTTRALRMEILTLIMSKGIDLSIDVDIQKRQLYGN